MTEQDEIPSPHRIQSAVAFLDGEIRGLRSRIGATGNSAQEAKMAHLQFIRSVVAALARREAA